MSLTLLLKFCLPQLYNLDNPSVFAVILMKRKIGLDFHFSPILFFLLQICARWLYVVSTQRQFFAQNSGIPFGFFQKNFLRSLIANLTYEEFRPSMSPFFAIQYNFLAVWVLRQYCQYESNFFSNCKVIINWGMSKTSKGGECQNQVGEIKQRGRSS